MRERAAPCLRAAAPTCPRRAFYFLRLYGDWLVGFNETRRSLAWLRTACSVRPSLSPMTRVGVFWAASCRSCVFDDGVQALPLLRVDFDISVSFSIVMQCNPADPERSREKWCGRHRRYL